MQPIPFLYLHKLNQSTFVFYFQNQFVQHIFPTTFTFYFQDQLSLKCAIKKNAFSKKKIHKVFCWGNFVTCQQKIVSIFQFQFIFVLAICLSKHYTFYNFQLLFPKKKSNNTTKTTTNNKCHKSKQQTPKFYNGNKLLHSTIFFLFFFFLCLFGRQHSIQTQKASPNNSSQLTKSFIFNSFFFMYFSKQIVHFATFNFYIPKMSNNKCEMKNNITI